MIIQTHSIWYLNGVLGVELAIQLKGLRREMCWLGYQSWSLVIEDFGWELPSRMVWHIGVEMGARIISIPFQLIRI